MRDLAPIIAAVAGATGLPLRGDRTRPLSTGMSEAFRVDDATGRAFFLKLHDAAAAAMFEAEAEGLAELAGVGAVRVPAVQGHGVAGGRAFLLLEYLELRAGSAAAAAALGTALARLHRHTAPAFGWRRDNTIGTTPQPNGWHDDWCTFFRDCRIGVQLARAGRTGQGQALAVTGARLLDHLPALLAGHAPAPSLLHGDLWGGNWSMTEYGEPVVFDPAVYYGDREVDLAMTRLFGGFPESFYEAYNRAWPLPAGWERRRDLYNLYHVLNHLNLFGAGYLPQALDLMERIA